MDYYRINSYIYSLLSKHISNVQRLSYNDILKEDKIPSLRVEESKFVITKDISNTNYSTVTAHVLKDYRPNNLRIERLLQESQILTIDRLLKDLEVIRGVPIQSN